MRKFVLIKKYPGSLGVGYEVEFQEGKKEYVITLEGPILTLNECVQYPEFWKEVTEPTLEDLEKRVKILEEKVSNAYYKYIIGIDPYHK